MEKQAQNIQESFLNNARKDKTFLTIYLMSGVKLSGKIKSFDKYSVVLETNNQEQLIFKHAISTVVVSRPFHAGSAFERRGRLARGSRNSGRTCRLAGKQAFVHGNRAISRPEAKRAKSAFSRRADQRRRIPRRTGGSGSHRGRDAWPIAPSRHCRAPMRPR